VAQHKLKDPIGPRLAASEMQKLKLPPGAVLANTAKQRPHTIDYVRYYYKDRPFNCKQCGKREVWGTDAQRHWYEECQGHIEAVAILCRSCRKGELHDQSTES
jgi:hypothetical protein